MPIFKLYQLSYNHNIMNTAQYYERTRAIFLNEKRKPVHNNTSNILKRETPRFRTIIMIYTCHVRLSRNVSRIRIGPPIRKKSAAERPAGKYRDNPGISANNGVIIRPGAREICVSTNVCAKWPFSFSDRRFCVMFERNLLDNVCAEMMNALCIKRDEIYRFQFGFRFVFVCFIKLC